MTLTYQEVKSIEKLEAEQIFQTHDTIALSDALVRVTFHEPNWRWVQEWCIHFIDDPEPTIQKVAITCLGHLARIHSVLDTPHVVPLLEALLEDPLVGGVAQDALDDIAMFVRNQHL